MDIGPPPMVFDLQIKKTKQKKTYKSLLVPILLRKELRKWITGKGGQERDHKNKSVFTKHCS